MKINVKNPFQKASEENIFSCIDYRHTPEYRRYIANAVSAEKKILINRCIDEFNVGHTTRSFEMKQFIDAELRDAENQLSNHHHEYQNMFEKNLSELTVKKNDSSRLAKDLADIKSRIANLESILSKENS